MQAFLRRLAVPIAASFLPVAVLLDLLAFPTQPLSVLYAIPMLAAALWLSPRGTSVLVALTLPLSLIADERLDPELVEICYQAMKPQEKQHNMPVKRVVSHTLM